MSKIIAEHIFKKGMDSSFVQQIIATHNFPHQSTTTTILFAFPSQEGGGRVLEVYMTGGGGGGGVRRSFILQTQKIHKPEILDPKKYLALKFPNQKQFGNLTGSVSWDSKRCGKSLRYRLNKS